MGYTFTISASEYVIAVDFLYPTTVDRVGILSAQSGTNVEAFSVVLDQSPEYPRYEGRVGMPTIVDASNTAQSSGLTYQISRTTDGKPPRNVVIYIEGCNQILPGTKAQVEAQGSTTRAGSFAWSSFFSNKYIPCSCLVSHNKYHAPGEYVRLFFP